MRKLVVLGLLVSMLYSCSSSDHGELVGVQGRPEWFPTLPYGMVYIPQGSYNMGSSDQDVAYAMTAPSKTVTVGSFFMDQTEITNNEYRQFVYWVRDSIVRFRLGDEELVEGYELKDLNNMDELTPYQEYVSLNYPDSMQRHIDWDKRLIWDKNRYPSEEYTEIMESIYLPPEERFLGKRIVDARQLIYVYYWMDKQKAARKENRVEYDLKDEDGDGEYFSYRDYIKDGRELSDRSSFFNKEQVPIYPDTLAWIHDFTYAFNEPKHDKYFWHPAYDEYPVVGVNWNQAKAFCNWRSYRRDKYLTETEQMKEYDFRLPSEAEWEYAARGGQNLTTYPWGGPASTNSSGCFLANFKPLRGNYTADGGFHTVKVTSYNPNGFNLFCMSGNVAEWTNTAYQEEAYMFMADGNPEYEYRANEFDEERLKQKVVRGGSWKDVAAYLQVSTRDFEYQDTTRSYIGFRCVQDFLGRDLSDF